MKLVGGKPCPNNTQAVAAVKKGWVAEVEVPEVVEVVEVVHPPFVEQITEEV